MDTMHYETILYHVHDKIALITLNRPAVGNSLNAQMRVELLHVFRTVAKQARVVIYSGTDGVFCSGQDLGDAKRVNDIDLQKMLREEYQPLLYAIYNCPIPTIAAVNGPAAGTGANLALAADIVIASHNAVFVQAFSHIGLIPDAGATYWLPRQIGFARAMGAALFADRITAQMAAEWGMIWQAVAEESFKKVLYARAKQLANGPTEGYRLIKKALRQSFDQTLEQQLKTEAYLQGQAGRTYDFTEGILAFLEKRQPKFNGR